LLCACLFLCLSLPAHSQQQNLSDEAAVKLAAENFVDAFNNLDWDRFEASWAQDATVFFPMDGQPKRVEGRGAIIAIFRSLFESLPERAEGPPYLSIQPLNTNVQMLGDSAVVSFHLGESGPWNRRTIVFARHEDRWLIAHLHASRLAAPPEE
jgi:ketosteroid isomerase-like protein